MSLKPNKETRSILVYKSYGGLGDIFFTLPSLYLLKQQFQKVTFATQGRLVNLFKSNMKDIDVVDEDKVDPNEFDEVIELGNYPRFNNNLEKKPQIIYHTHKKVKQHSIGHYLDGITAVFPSLRKTNAPFPYFEKRQTNVPYYTVHAGAGFILKAWPAEYYAQLIEMIHELFPSLLVKLIIGPNDPNPENYFTKKDIPYELITGDIDDVAHAVSGAQFHIGNDAGITHLAGAFNIPILTIYGPTGPGSWGAFSEKVELIWGKKGNCNLRCRYEVILNCPERVCLSNVTPKRMRYSLFKLLNRIQTSDATEYIFNPEFHVQIESDHLIFKSKENEYLIEFNDEDSRKFIMENIKKEKLDIDRMPTQLNEIFEAMIRLDLIHQFPSINFYQS